MKFVRKQRTRETCDSFDVVNHSGITYIYIKTHFNSNVSSNVVLIGNANRSSLFSGWIQFDLFTKRISLNTGRHNSRLWNSEPVFAFLIEEHRKNNGRTIALIEELGKTHHFFISVYYSLSWRNENHQYETIEDPYQESRNEWSECFE